MVLGFVQLCMTGVFQTLVPFGYLTYLSGTDAEVGAALLQIQELSATNDSLELSPQDVEDRAELLAPLFERIPWGRLALLASLVIYPFLGRMAGRYLGRPESSGLLILLSAGMGQNLATIPLGLQYAGMGQIALPLSEVIGIVLFQFLALAVGIFSTPEVKEYIKKGSPR